uniref:Uncharacterized protein n=1 Tax=Fagus sylvatica TaxID=28930 RepID=A0A2N9J564_FAGSY
MMEQKDIVPVNLSKKRRGNSASKPVSDKVVVCPLVVPESIPIVQVVDKAPTLALDASLALRQAKSVATKEDMDEYGKLNTDIGLTEAMVVANSYFSCPLGGRSIDVDFPFLF